MRKTGISAASLYEKGKPFELNEDVFILCHENNITAMEVSLPFGGPFFDIDFEQLNVFSKKYNVELWSFHVPFGDEYDPSTLDEKLRRNMLASFEKLIDMASVTEIQKIVIHPSAEPVETDKETRVLRMKAACESLSKLCEYADAKGMKIAVECLPRTCLGTNIEEMQELVSANPKLEICFDVNHIAPGTHRKFVEALGDRITTVHICDYVIEDNHYMPFDGNIDWKELIGLLDSIDYSGPFLYEVGRYNNNKSYTAAIYDELHRKIRNL